MDKNRRLAILKSFGTEDLKNPVTAQSISEALENADRN